ncbi:nucleoside 2-deoxyribosyltransferase [Fundicoccus sp. Sow4_H7]|uniref:nucleoside 2-deoxyribosyltransferase n=1 Tax=Fundicoccus sp. Sow4_H7 TaxID=3438784 RepID=UPI003F90234B
MKIYFAASIRGGRQDAELYKELIAFLKEDHQVLTEHIGDNLVTDEGEKNLSDKEIRDRDIAWIVESDVMIAETTRPSLGVGYELAYAEFLQKPVIILHRQEVSPLSAMIAGTDYFDKIFYYSNFDEAVKILESELT